MKKIKGYAEFNSKYDYIEYLEENNLITHGCSLCMIENGVCEDAVKKFVEDNFVTDKPFSDIDENEFPVSCLKEWYGEEYVEGVLAIQS